MTTCETCGGPDGREFGAYQVCEPCQKKHWRKVKNPKMLLERYEPDYTEVLIEEDAQRWEREQRDHGSDPEDQSWEDIMGGTCDEYFVEEDIPDPYDAALALIDEMASTSQQRTFLDALSVGHGFAEAQRIAEMTYGQMRSFLRRIRP